MGGLIAELRRRNVFRVGAVYGVVGWLLAQAAVVLETALSLPSWFDGVIVSALLLGFPIALLLAWAFELTPDGFQATADVHSDTPQQTRKRRGLNLVLGGALVLAIGFIVLDRPNTERSESIAETPASAQPVREASIAVLPFADMSASGDQVYFGDGIAEELLNLLARVDGLRVASRTSAFTFRERTSSITEIAEALDVAHVLEGSIRKSGNQVRITAQLIETGNDEHLWSETYDRALTAENLFAIQDEIATAIVTAVGGQLKLGARQGLPTHSTKAYELFLSGRAKIETRLKDDILSGLEELKRAATLDPGFINAHILTARAYALARVYAEMDEDKAIEAAQRHHALATAIDPDNPRLALEIAWSQYNRPGFMATSQIDAFSHALALNPNNPEAHRGMYNVLANLGRFDEARPYGKKALELDPRSTILLISMGQDAIRRNQIDKARSYLARVLKIDPKSALARLVLSDLNQQDGQIALAHRIAKSAEAEPRIQQVLKEIYYNLGMLDEFERYDAAEANAVRAMISGDQSEVLRYIDILKTKDGTSEYTIIFPLGLKAQAREIFETEESIAAFLTGGNPIESFFFATTGIDFIHAYSEIDPKRVAIVSEKLRNFFAGQPTDEIFSTRDAWVKACWYAQQGDPKALYATLDEILSRDIPMALWDLFHTFDPYRSEPEFIERQLRMKTIVARHRAEVEADLANPPDPWWSPEEL